MARARRPRRARQRVSDITSESVRFLEQRFAEREPEAVAERGGIRLHSEPERPVTAAEVAGALAGNGVRAVHERQEWCVVDVAAGQTPQNSPSRDRGAR